MLPHAQALVEKLHEPTNFYDKSDGNYSDRPNLFPSILKLDNIDTVGYQAMLPKKRVFTSQSFHSSLVGLVPQQTLIENPYIFAMFPDKKKQ